MNNKLRRFQENDAEGLYHTAKYLYFNTSFFSTYLTQVQLQTIETIFNTDSLPKSDSKLLWIALMNGKLLLKSTSDPDTLSGSASPASDDALSGTNILNCKSISLRVRSLLWSKATSYYCHHQSMSAAAASSASARAANNDVFSLLHEDDDSDFEDASSDPQQIDATVGDKAVASTGSTSNVKSSAIPSKRTLDNEDDDYDDDYDDEQEEIEADGADKGTTDAGESTKDSDNNEQSIFQHYKDFIILDITPRNISPNDAKSPNESVDTANDNQAEDSKPEDRLSADTSTTKSKKSNTKLISTKMSTSLNTSDTLVTAQEQKIIQNLNSVYHSFENDKETLMKRQKLEANDKLIDEEDADDSNLLKKKNTKKDDGGDNANTNAVASGIGNVGLTSQLSMNIGSTNLSLKYLLKLIDTNQEKVPNLTPRELRNLIHDVKKTKSKWSSDDKIGQEELYEAAEKVVLELRGYTQHSTPFLTKVSKREAPNYYSIIKHPMDLNTVIKKLKGLEYRSKQAFVADLMLIWSNCLTYNTDPNHQLRKDAIAMKRKTLSLLPLIPDIVIRTRAEIEKEEKELELRKQRKKMANANNGAGLSAGLSTNSNISSSSKKGVSRTQGIVRASTPAATDLEDSSQAENSQQEFASSSNLDESVVGTPAASVAISVMDGHQNTPAAESTAENTADATPIPTTINNSTVTNASITEDCTGAIQNDDDPDDDYEIDSQSDLQKKNGNSNAQIDLLSIYNDSNTFNDEDSNDLESQVWNNYTSKLRGDFLLRRSKLFIRKNGADGEISLNADSEAVLRDPVKMAEFLRIVSGNYHEEESTNPEKKGDEDNETDKYVQNGKNGSPWRSKSNGKKSSTDNDNTNNSESTGKLDDDQQQGNDLHLTEYDVINGIPLLGYNGIDDSELTRKENEILEDLQIRKRIFNERQAAKLIESNSKSNVLNEEFKIRSDFLPPENGLNHIVIDNVTQMQEIRKICFKISLIRQMQQNQVIHHTQMKAPQYSKITDIDLDAVQIESENVVSEHKSNGEFVYCVLRKNVCKLLMNTGFEGSDPYAADLVTQLAENFMSNLIRTIKLHLESVSSNRIESVEKILLLSLMENGVGKPDELCSYVKDGILKQNQKLKELKSKLSNFLKELLRPSLMSFQSEKDLINEKNFSDNSDQFLTGDFSNELGEDFFGFRELGLDKEFRMLSSSIPLHLLNSKLSKSFFHSSSNKENEENFIENFDREIKYEKLHKEDIEKQIQLIQPFLNRFFEKSKAIYLKNYKNNNNNNDKIPFTNKEEEMLILEDEDLPQKQRNIRPRILPNGKISGIKKKTVGNAFFLDEDPNDITASISNVVPVTKKGAAKSK